jgi:outer membrane protein assembly factor BamB
MLIAVNKHTGEAVARDDADIGWRLLHGTWSSPSLGKVNGKTLIFFGGPDGYCYALDPTPVKEPGKKLATLKVVWKCDANAPQRRERNGEKLAYRAKDENKYGDGPSECIATPVFHKGRVYVDVGQDPRHGKGHGNLACIDASKTGDITKTGTVWSYDKLDRSLSTVSICGDLLFVADFSGKLHCVDLKTGKPRWVFDTESPLWSSTFVVDGKVFLGTERQDLYVFAASKEQKLLNRIKLHDKSYTTPIVANGVLYVTSQSQLWAITQGGK